MLKSAKEILNAARINNIAVPAFNVSTLESLQAIFEAAAETKLPVIIEASSGEAKHIQPQILFAICETLGKQTGVDYALHYDRGNDLEYMKELLDAGFNSISADFAKTFEENMELTIQARELTNKYDAQLEGGMEYVPYVGYTKMKAGDLQYTDPEKTIEFVKTTQVDSLIVSIGTQSGKFKEISDIKFNLIAEVRELLPELPLVLHGGSFLDEKIVQKAIAEGINKINLNSEIRIAFTNKLKENIQANPDEYAPYRILNGVKAEMQKIAVEKLLLYALKK